MGYGLEWTIAFLVEAEKSKVVDSIISEKVEAMPQYYQTERYLPTIKSKLYAMPTILIIERHLTFCVFICR